MDYKQFEKLRNEMSINDLKQFQQAAFNETDEIYNMWLAGFMKEYCIICKKSLDHVDTVNPCMHLLIVPNIKKRLLFKIFDNYGLFEVYSFLRWVANTDKKLVNINDISLETEEKNYLQVTIKYKEFEFTLLCSEGDIKGHEGSNVEYPHYHFELEYSGNKIIKLNQSHIRLTEDDIVGLKHMKEQGAKVYSGVGGMGMDDAFDIPLEDIVFGTAYTEDASIAPFHMDTFATFDAGIDGEELFELIEKAKRDKVTVASLLQQRADSATTIIEAGEAVPEMKKRKKR